MLSKEEIENSKRNLIRVLETDPLTSTIDFQYIDVSNALEYIEQLEKENKELQESVNQIYDDYQEVGKEMFKYSEQVEQLEEKEQKIIEKLEKEKYKIECTYSQINGNYFMAQDRLDLIKEILSMIKGEEKNGKM